VNRKLLKSLVEVVAALLLLAAAYLLFVFLMQRGGATPEQQAALDALREPNPTWEGRNAYAAIWAMGRAIPDDQLDAVLREDVPRVDAGTGGIEPGNGRFPVLPELAADSPGLCRSGEPCLAEVRSHREAAQALLQVHAARLRQGLSPALLEAGHATYPFRPTLNSPIGGPVPFPLLRTHYALRYLEGDVAGALGGLCRQMLSWRRLATRTDALVIALVGSRATADDARLVGEMLAELPPDLGLPSDCEAAFSDADAAELDLCPSMRTEFRLIDSLAGADNPGAALGMRQGWIGKPLRWLLDREALLARSAGGYAAHCGEGARAALAADSRYAVPEPASCSTAEFLADPLGCELVEAYSLIGAATHAHRRMDLRAQLLLLRIQVWLRTQAGDPRPLAELLAARPAELQPRSRHVDLDDSGTELRVGLLDTRNGPYWTLPVPTALRAPAAPAAPAAPPGG
jgi:hypothetical protein